MKKRLIAFLVAALAAIITVFGGCSCSGNDSLSFNSINANAETLSYKVEYVQDYNESTKKNAELDKYFTPEFPEYTDGTYKSEYKAADKSEITSDILDSKAESGKPLIDTVYLLNTEFKIKLKITIKDKDFEHTEKITTKAYIAPYGASFAPLYAEEDAEYTVISVGTETKVSVLKSVTKTYYDKNEYRTEQTAKSFSENETVTLDGVEPQERTTDYTFRSAIDNAELLFAIRGLKINEKASETINAVWSAYESPQPLKITNTQLAEKQFTLNYNGESVTETIKYSSLVYALDKTNASGASQYANVQTDAAGKINNTCLLLEYVKPLIVYGGTFMSMGALKFTLESVTVS